MKEVPGYIKYALANSLNAIERQKLLIRKENDYLIDLTERVIKKFCPVKVGEIFTGTNLTIQIKKITWHYGDNPLGLFWQLAGTVVKSDGTPDGRFAGLHTVQCYDFSEEHWKPQVQQSDPSRFAGEYTCGIGKITYDGNIIISGESDCPVHGFQG